MMGERYLVEVTLECFGGPDSAVQLTLKALYDVGWLWVPEDATRDAVLLPGEGFAFVTGARNVVCCASVIVQSMQAAEGECLGCEIAEAVVRQLRSSGIVVHAVTVGSYVQQEEGP